MFHAIFALFIKEYYWNALIVVCHNLISWRCYAYVCHILNFWKCYAYIRHILISLTDMLNITMCYSFQHFLF